MVLLHKYARFALFLTLIVFSAVSLGAQEEPVNYQNLILEVLEGYQELMNTRLDDDVEDVPFETWYVMSQAINQGFLRFTVDPERTNLILGAQFLITPSSNQPYIFMSQSLLNTWKKYPGLSYTLLSGAFREAYIFFKSPGDWRLARADALDSIFMDSEKYMAEALMIRDRLIPSGYIPTPYETYILDSFESDGLTSAMLFLKGASLPVAQAFNEVRVGFEENGNAEDLRAALLAAGKSLLEERNKLPANAKEEQIFPLAVAIHTWLETSPAIISRVYNKNRTVNPLTFPQVLEEEPAYKDLRRLMEASRTRDMLLIEHTVDETLKGFAAPKKAE